MAAFAKIGAAMLKKKFFLLVFSLFSNSFESYVLAVDVARRRPDTRPEIIVIAQQRK